MHTTTDHTPPRTAPTQAPKHTSVDMRRVACVILGGGQGSRLAPLTLTRCKPAISFGGRYRLVDVPISNAINAHIPHIAILTQFLSASLHRHLAQTHASVGIEILGVEQKPDKANWYQGTADAVRQHVDYLRELQADYFLILSGDQLYTMDFQAMFQQALQCDADLLIATLAVDRGDASRLGIMRINEDQQIVEFCEKPSDPVLLDRLQMAPALLERLGLPPGKSYLGSMGIYLFKRQALFDLLLGDPREDFGKHLIPTKVAAGNVAAYPHMGYWEDIGTVESFFGANIALTGEHPPFDCYNEHHPIHTTRQHLPGAKVNGTQLMSSIVCEGVVCEAESVTSSILGQRAIVHRGTHINHSYVMGNECYGHVAPTIGSNCRLERCIVDHNATIGNGVQLVNKKGLPCYNGEHVHVRDGIIVVPRGATIPDGFIF